MAFVELVLGFAFALASLVACAADSPQSTFGTHTGVGGSAAAGSHAGSGAGISTAGASAAGRPSGASGVTASAGMNASASGRGGANAAGMSTAGSMSGASGGTGTVGMSQGSLLDRLGTTDSTVPAGVKPGTRNFRVWVSSMLKIAPTFTVPLANCGTLVGFTSGTAASPNARAARLDANDQLVDTLDLGAGLELRGLAAEADGHFGALLWSSASQQIWLKRFDLTGMQGFSTELTNLSTMGVGPNKPTDFSIGESRVEFGGGKYGAYYHVHSDSGHEGDTLKYVPADSGTEMTTWPWGCSHSMSELLTFNPMANAFLATCVTDCYPGTTSSDFATGSIGGIYTENRNKVLALDGGCNGSVGGELGSAAVAPTGWKIVFNGHQAPATNGQMSYNASTMNQDIGFASIGSNHMLTGSVVWLTTSMANEADSSIARFAPAGDSSEQYVVGWLEPPSAYKLARIDGAGSVLEAPVDVSAKAKWGQRDDPFRVHVNGDIVWAWFDTAGSTTLHFARLRSGSTAQCAMF